MKTAFFLAIAISMFGGEQPVTLRQAVDMALQQNPDITLARLSEQHASESIRVAQDPFHPKVYVGSGLAWTNGFPMSIEGSAPSVLQARAVSSIYNMPQRYGVAQARENARGATLDVASRREEVALRTAMLYLDAERMMQAAKTARKQMETLEQLLSGIRLRIQEGRELPIEKMKGELKLAQARQRAEAFEFDLRYIEESLAVVIGLSADDRAIPTEEERTFALLSETEDSAVESALESSKEIRRIESSILAKGFEVKANQSRKLPQIDLVAQYALFAKFNNYEDYFRSFQRHNGQLGISFQVPVYTGSAAKAMAAQGNTEIQRLRVEAVNTRNRITLEARKAHQDVARAQRASEVAGLDLAVAREQVAMLLAQMQEGRVTLRQVEEARFLESEKWLGLYDTRYNLERAKLNLLKHTGLLLAALK
jgi:outer membrane protein